MGEGWGNQFGGLERKPGTLSTLCSLPTLALVRSTTRLPPFFSPDFSVFSGDSEKIIKRISHFVIKLPVQLPRKYYKQNGTFYQVFEIKK